MKTKLKKLIDSIFETEQLFTQVIWEYEDSKEVKLELELRRLKDQIVAIGNEVCSFNEPVKKKK